MQSDTSKPTVAYTSRPNFFHLSSPVGEYTQHESNRAEEESANSSSYTDILKRTFKDFSVVPVGSDVEIVHLHRQYPPKVAAAAEEELEDGELEQDAWTVDVQPMRGYVEGDSNSIIFDGDDDGEPPNEPADLPSFHGQVVHVLPFTRNSWLTSITYSECWNCLQQGHTLAHCPHPRNHLQINHSRELFFYARDNLPPPRAERYLHDYLNMRLTIQEKERRLELLERFRPGKLGKSWITLLGWWLTIRIRMRCWSMRSKSRKNGTRGIRMDSEYRQVGLSSRMDNRFKYAFSFSFLLPKHLSLIPRCIFHHGLTGEIYRPD